MTEEHHRLALPRGTRIDDFEFHRVLGHGGFGLTYLGWNLRLDIPVAIKEYLPSDLAVREQDLSVVPKASSDASDFRWGLDRFVDEARTLARFQHPNIVRVHHFFEAHGTAYIAMEYAEGETLTERLARQEVLSESELLGLVVPLLDGLAVVHGANVLHRDIKPGNIIIRDADGSPVLLDFGSARQAIGAKSRSMTSVVTPGYAPIEQYSTRGEQGAWTDIYALGGVCYRALTGQVPADATDRVRRDPLVPIGQLCGGRVSEGLLAAVDWALQVDEGDRPQSVEAWRGALVGEGVAPAAPAPAVVPTVSEPVAAAAEPSDSSARPSAAPAAGLGRVFWVVLGLCLVGLVGLGGYWGLGQIEEARQAEALAGEVSLLLGAAAEDLSAGRLTSPGGNNAWERYQAVLELVPGHGEAQAGLDTIIVRYGALLDAALSAGDFAVASGYIARVRAVYPDASVLGGWQRRLSSAEALAAEEAEAARQAEIERERKAEEAARAAALERQRQAELARQAALERERQAEEERRRAEAAARQRKAGTSKTFSLPGGGEMAFVWVPAGRFRMGSPESERSWAVDRCEDGGSERNDCVRWYGNEGPLHAVEISRGFWLGKYEVTQGEWSSVMGSNPSRYTGDSRRPVETISWNDVQEFIAKLNDAAGSSVYRLPSEAEWEYACRAGTLTRWSFGDGAGRLGDYAWYAGNYVPFSSTKAVGGKLPNGWGLYDMHGNVWEWVQDWYGEDYYKSSPRVDPQGPTSGASRVMRGGHFGAGAQYVRSAGRYDAPPGIRYYGIGVRLLRLSTP